MSCRSEALVLAVGLLLLSGGLNGLPMEWVGPAVAIGLGVVIAVAARPARPPSERGQDELPSTAGEPWERSALLTANLRCRLAG
jgi:hypothetical protein